MLRGGGGDAGEGTGELCRVERLPHAFCCVAATPLGVFPAACPSKTAYRHGSLMLCVIAYSAPFPPQTRARKLLHSMRIRPHAQQLHTQSTLTCSGFWGLGWKTGRGTLSGSPSCSLE
jgi:hypothetical protein